MRYQLAETIKNTLEIKKSQFITWLIPIADRAEGMEWLAKSKTEYPDARHHCWAYVLGDSPNSQSAAMSDDGEPSGTAGKPMLNVLQHKPANNVMVIVIRYFGGIKLGAGGLVRAYSQAVEQSFQLATLLPIVPKATLDIVLPFANEQWLRHQCDQLSGNILKVNYQSEVNVTMEIPEAELSTLTDLLVAHQFQYRTLEK
ncbi:YigZ family protein [Psychrosphaera haliotis]|uniref:YigZ family protein n=1 Tax=Psychrosphaera haliotis TaxID=555083 RepID=A0A6N8F4Z5_9GAMM|nr:YigZ family protein [Psychrosphaera haliotis]MUH71635.1 YigZ family protein [Psychrosphaera haliotis]